MTFDFCTYTREPNGILLVRGRAGAWKPMLHGRLTITSICAGKRTREALVLLPISSRSTRLCGVELEYDCEEKASGKEKG